MERLRSIPCIIVISAGLSLVLAARHLAPPRKYPPIKYSTRQSIWLWHKDRPGYYGAAVRVAHASRQGGQQRHRQPTFYAVKITGHFVAEFPFMEEVKLYGCPLNMTNRSLMAHRNIFAARPDPQT